MAPSRITNVSDTARWTALHRAVESARPDALFDDPLAVRLAGEHGQAIVSKAPWSMRNGWWLVARTRTIDDTIARAITAGCDRVLNLAAGLDTRPYRLNLPADFSWIEADLPPLLAEKTELLGDKTPGCRLTRVPVDLADPQARDAFLDDALRGAGRAMVLTEGLLMYLADRDVADLSAALRRPEIAWWLTDFWAPSARKTYNRAMSDMADNAPFTFAPANGLAFFEGLGWRVAEAESLLDVAYRFRRLPMSLRPLAWLPTPNPRHPGRRLRYTAALLSRG